MHKKKTFPYFKLLFAILGMAAVIVALFAYPLGLDNNAIMGNRRKLLLAVGIFLLLLHPLSIGFTWLDKSLGIRRRLHAINGKIANTRFSRWITPILFPANENPPGQRKQLNTWIWAVGGSAIVIFVSLWYITAGTLTHWTPYSRYYDRQADAFLAGQLSLLEAPPVKLAALPNVYDVRQRVGIDYIWDASYYNGKYYLYWGPVPALVAAGIKLVHPGVVEDQYLVMLFMSALTLTLAAFFRWIKRSYFPAAPGWTVFLFTLTTALCAPLLFIVNRPCVYEAAISSAQFFLVLGLYGTVRAIAGRQHRTGWLVLAGIGLGAAVSSRFTYIVAVIFISAFLMVMLLKEVLAHRSKWVQLLAYIVPLSVFAAGLAWFNFARFGSILESGLRYQLTGDALPEDFRLLFSTDYFLPNAYLALFRPITYDPTNFPFLFVHGVTKDTFPGFIHLTPAYFFSERIVGAMASIPFLWTLLFPLVTVVIKVMAASKRTPNVKIPQIKLMPSWLVLLLTGTALALFGTLMLYVMSTLRFEVDFVPVLMLLAGIVCWQFLSLLDNKPELKRILIFVLILLCISTIVISLFLAFQSENNLFKINNLALYKKIDLFFTGK